MQAHPAGGFFFFEAQQARGFAPIEASQFQSSHSNAPKSPHV